MTLEDLSKEQLIKLVRNLSAEVRVWRRLAEGAQA